MNQLTTLNIIILLGGFLLHVLITVQTALAKNKQEFRLGVWITENWLSGVISLVCAFLSLVMAEDMIKAFGFMAPDGSAFYKFHALGSGYLGRDLIFRVLKMARNVGSK
jgi:hypothetical protein